MEGIFSKKFSQGGDKVNTVGKQYPRVSNLKTSLHFYSMLNAFNNCIGCWVYWGKLLYAVHTY